MSTPTISLNNDVTIPALGFGVFQTRPVLGECLPVGVLAFPPSPQRS